MMKQATKKKLTAAESTEPVPGLRLRKKAAQKAEILGAAMQLLERNGFDGCRIEDIANVANVSLKTVYNYFPNKKSILVDLLREDRLVMQSAYEEIIAKPPSDLAEALARIIHADVGDVVTPQKKRLWRELLAAEMRTHENADDDFEKNREVYTHYVKTILLHYRKKGKLSPKIDIDVAVHIIYGVMAHNFRQYCAIDDITPRDLLDSTRKQMKVLLMPWCVPIAT
jgi:AcrR family transcriptional regulator